MKEFQDYFFHKAKQENYPARSVYKLKEINDKFKVFKQGQKVLDLGASPGSWTMGAAELVGEKGLIISADIQDLKISLPSFVKFYKEDVFTRSEDFEKVLKDHMPFDVIMSDMAPKTTGHKGTDQARSAALYEEALAMSCLYLSKGGTFIVKVFMGPDLQEFVKEMKKYFSIVKAFKPKSSRAESYETFYIGKSFLGI